MRTLYRTVLASAGENAETKHLEFFAVNIRNLNAREAYARACAQYGSALRIPCAKKRATYGDFLPTL